MNFTPELSAFQGAILSADNVHNFSKLSAKGGNEDAINFVVGSLSSFLEQAQYVVGGKISSSYFSQVRTFAIYIVLNADLAELQQLVELEDICTLIWSTPTIQKCLMCELMWNLHMKRFISEIISYANPQLALEVAEAFLDHFKYFDPLDCNKKLQLLSSACYTLICRLHLFEYQHQELQAKSTGAYNNFQKCLKYYTTPPNNHKLNALSKAELYKYQGKSLYSLLQLIDECMMQFTSKLNADNVICEIYALTYTEYSLKKENPSFNICESPNNVLLECLTNANTAMLDTCKVLVMDVSVDVFCCWSEFEENGKSMQQTIGELCYKVNNKLSTLTSLAEHPVVGMLEQISRKPVEMKEKVNATDDSNILQNINNNNEESKLWIKALVHKEKLCQNSELLEIVHLNIDMYDADECYLLYSILKQDINIQGENKDLIELLKVKVFEKCELSKRFEILEQHFNNKTYVDMKETQHFQNAMTSVFNKLIATPDSDLTDILTIFLQNPQQVLMRIFSLASENAQQTQIMLKAMNLLEKFSDHYYTTETESCVIQMTQKLLDTLDSEAKENNFIQFLSGLKNSNIISGTKLLLLIVMSNMHKALLGSNIGRLNLQLKLLKEAYKLEELIQYRAPMLAMIGQVLDVVRWQINTFSAIAPGTLSLALDIQTTLLKLYNGQIPDNESQWLKSKLKNLKPLNMYYYRILWDPPGSNFLEIVTSKTITNSTEMERLSGWLSQLISSCTQQEWCEIWDSLMVFNNKWIMNIIHKAVAMVTDAEKSNRTEKSAACISYCYRNFMYVTRYKFLKEPLTDEQVQSVVSKVAMIAESVDEEDNSEEFGNIFMPIFAYLTEKQSDYDINLVECLNDNLGHTKLSSMINKVFLNGTG